MSEDRPLYIVFICPNCVALRRFKLKCENGSNVYRCHVCGFEVSHDNGVTTNIGISQKGSGRTPQEPLKRYPLYIRKKRLRSNSSGIKGVVRNPNGRRGKPK